MTRTAKVSIMLKIVKKLKSILEPMSFWFLLKVAKHTKDSAKNALED